MQALPPEPLYLPFEPGPFRMTMGVVARDPDTVIAIDERYPEEMAARRAILAEWGREVCAAELGAEAACAALLDMLAALLPRRYPDWFAREGAILHNHLTGERWDLRAEPPLALAARLVQEDLCLLRLTDSGPVLAAGVLCFSPGWRLLEKLGLPLAAVHGPVPLYADRLARPVDRLMQQLRPGKLVERLNWGLYDNPALFRPGSHFRQERNPDITVENAGGRLFLRVERQTLGLLPDSGYVLFGIHTHVYRLARVAHQPGAAGVLAESVRSMPAELRLYKSFAPFAEPMLAYLDRISGGPHSLPMAATPA